MDSEADSRLHGRAVLHFPEPEGDGVVEILEHILEGAKAGKYSAVCVVTVWRDGSTGDSYSKLHNTSTMIGAMTRAINSMMND